MRIRPMVIENYDSVYRLWTTTPGIGLNGLDDTREGIDRYLIRNPNTSFVSVKDDRIVGAILCGHDGRRGHIYHTAVAITERGRGIGNALVNAALLALEKEGISKAVLVTFADNESGNRFWEKRGFTTRNDLVYRNKAIKRAVRLDIER